MSWLLVKRSLHEELELQYDIDHCNVAAALGISSNQEAGPPSAKKNKSPASFKIWYLVMDDTADEDGTSKAVPNGVKAGAVEQKMNFWLQRSPDMPVVDEEGHEVGVIDFWLIVHSAVWLSELVVWCCLNLPLNEPTKYRKTSDD